MEDFAIGDVARRVGVQPSALRYYESIGILPAPRRVNGRRRYGAAILQRLTIIQLAQQAGFTLAEIRTLFEGFAEGTAPSARWRVLAQRKLPEIEESITRAQGMKRLLEEGLRCGCLTLEECTLVAEHVQSRTRVS
ncbi:MAG: MerR family transcriptional regulator [Chloroflexi bacterium]|nr:MerR family transcriptional regulator [Chloroflexota bacterium]